jgi:hypothetical protein
VVESGALPPLAIRSEAGNGPDTARVCTLSLPGNPDQGEANQTTARFCSPGSTGASWARYILDVPSGTRARFQAVSYGQSPTDSTFRIVRSAEATINGGLTNPYPPAILRITHTSQVFKYFIRIVGTNLSAVTIASLENSDHSWYVPLTITSRCDSVISCFGEGGRTLPSCTLEMTSSQGVADLAPISADPPLTSPQSSAVLGHMRDPNPNVYPKDFAFYFQRGNATRPDKFHMFYIRQPSGVRDPNASKGLGHQWSYDLISWTFADSTIIHPRNDWDNVSIWAPHVIAVGDTFYMYYTGVGTTNGVSFVQQIGLATSTSLDDTTWTRIASPVMKVSDVSWAAQNTAVYSGQQLRDPFVMADPEIPGQWLMLFTAVSAEMDPDMVIGVAKSADLRHWSSDSLFWNTDIFHNKVPGAEVVESPHIFPHLDASNRKSWWLFYTTNGFPVDFQYDRQSLLHAALADSTQNAANWSIFNALYHYEHEDPAFANWTASEYVKANFYWQAQPSEYLAAYTGVDISIAKITWVAGASIDSMVLGNPLIAGLRPTSVGEPAVVDFGIAELRLGSGVVRFRLEASAATRVALTLMDIQGRRIKSLVDGPVGVQPVSVTWDGRNAAGGRVGSGMYFARLTWPGGAKVIKVPLLR